MEIDPKNGKKIAIEDQTFVTAEVILVLRLKVFMCVFFSD